MVGLPERKCRPIEFQALFPVSAPSIELLNSTIDANYQDLLKLIDLHKMGPGQLGMQKHPDDPTAFRLVYAFHGGMPIDASEQEAELVKTIISDVGNQMIIYICFRLLLAGMSLSYAETRLEENPEQFICPVS